MKKQENKGDELLVCAFDGFREEFLEGDGQEQTIKPIQNSNPNPKPDIFLLLLSPLLCFALTFSSRVHYG